MRIQMLTSRSKMYFFLVISMLAGIPLLTISVANGTTAASNQIVIPTGNIIRIGAVAGEPLYNVSAFKLKKNTTYTIFYHVPDPTPTNLVIATDGRTIRNALDAVEKEGDIVLGPSANDVNPEAPGTWSVNWTTPNEDTYIIFFCSIVGYFEKGMRGYFQIGNPLEDPPSWGTITPSFSMQELLLLIVPTMVATRLKNHLNKNKHT